MKTEILNKITESSFGRIREGLTPKKPAIVKVFLEKAGKKADLDKIKAYLFPKLKPGQTDVYEIWTNGEISGRAEKLPPTEPFQPTK